MSDKIKNLNLAAAIFGVMAAACFMIYNLKGVSIGPDGKLEEAFYLVPIGTFLAILSGGFGAVAALLKRFGK